MPFLSKIIKPLLALTLSAAILGAQGCTKDSKPESKPAEPSAAAPAQPAAKPGEPRTIAISVTEKGYEPSPITLKQGEQSHKVALQVQRDGTQLALLASVGDSQLSLRLLHSDGRWLTFELDGIRQRQAYRLDGENLWLYGHFGNLALTDVSHAPAGGQSAASSGTIKAPMDGAIVDVLVDEGARVTKGQLLVVLEAMKMEHPLKAGIDGVIRRVGASRGDQVKNRQVLVEIEAEEA